MHFLYVSFWMQLMITCNCFVDLKDKRQATVVQKKAYPMHWKNDYPVDNVVSFVDIYPLDSDWSGGWPYQLLVKLGRNEKKNLVIRS